MNEKKSPPPLPKDAFKQPNHEMESPWDVQASAPAPKAAKPKLALPQWAGRAIAAHDHGQQLDLDAAVNEFGLKMPREQADDEAYKQYLYHPHTGQHAQAAFHHLAGMKAAHAAGDKEAALNHSLMYNLHAKALGMTPVDAARELSSHIKQPPKVYKFKAHRGDAFAVQPPPAETPSLLSTQNGVISSAPPPQLTKSEREVLYMLYLMSNAALAKGEVVGHIQGATPKQPKHKAKGFNDITIANGRKWAKQNGYEDKSKSKYGEYFDGRQAKKAEKSASGEIDVPKKALREGTFAKDRLPKVMVEKAKHAGHCHCTAYGFCHRYGGGKCMVVKP